MLITEWSDIKIIHDAIFSYGIGLFLTEPEYSGSCEHDGTGERLQFLKGSAEPQYNRFVNCDVSKMAYFS